jgi:hypothetical protein
MKWLVLTWVGMIAVLGCEAVCNSAPVGPGKVGTVTLNRQSPPVRVEQPIPVNPLEVPGDQLAMVESGACANGVCAVAPVRSTVQAVRSVQPVRSVARGVRGRVRGAVGAVLSIRPVRRLFGRGC